MGLLDSKITKLNNKRVNKFAKSYELMLHAKAHVEAKQMIIEGGKQCTMQKPAVK